ncbi:MAG TPA: sulfotransferase [Gammaproteobacteria bacterium]
MTDTAAVINADIDKAIDAFEAGDIVAAMSHAHRLLLQFPEDVKVLGFAAALNVADKRYVDASTLYNRLLAAARSPKDEATAWTGLSKIASLTSNLDAAEEAARRAMLLDSNSVQPALDFADVLLTRGKIDSSIEVLRSTISRFPKEPNPCVILGNALLKSGRQKDALVMYDMALKRDPNSSSAHFNASIALTMLGKLDAARTACENALKIAPDMAVYYQLANLGALGVDDPRVPKLESLLQDPKAPAETRIDAGFALAKSFDDAGDAARAFPYLQQANNLKRSTLDYDIAQDRERVSRIIALFTKDFLRRFATVSPSTLAPIFVLGMPRSGTTLLEQMLAGHSQVRAGGELPYMPEIARSMGIAWGSRGEASPGSDEQVTADLRRAIAEYTEATRTAQMNTARFTDKLPGNFMFIGLIHLMFPAASIIHCRRDPVDTCLSNYQRLYSSDVPYSYDLAELGQYHRLYQQLMRHWETVLPPGRILDVDYEAMVANSEHELRRVLAFCGLEYEASCLDFQNVSRGVSTASSVQVRKPLYDTSVHRWKRYAADLGPLMKALGIDPEKP